MNVSTEKKKIEALRRMKELGLFSQVITQFDKFDKICLNDSFYDLVLCVEDEDLKRIKEFEKKYNALVFTAIRDYTTAGKMDSFLFVSDYPEEWADERQWLKKGEATAYVYNHDLPYCSDMGVIGIMLNNRACLHRIW